MAILFMARQHKKVSYTTQHSPTAIINQQNNTNIARTYHHSGQNQLKDLIEIQDILCQYHTTLDIQHQNSELYAK